MSNYQHGIRVLEQGTDLVAPVEGTAGLQVIFGTAPVNQAADPYHTANTPMLCHSFSECVQNLGYNEDFTNYTLCQSMDINFRVFAVSPIILINVLDPTKHRKENTEEDYQIINKQVVLKQDGILLDTVIVKNGAETLQVETDYLLSFDTEGKAVITMLEDSISTIKVASSSIDPEAVTEADIVGGYDAQTGEESGIETVRQIYPRFNMAPGLLLAPGWSHKTEVGLALAAKSESVNEVFRCENLLDLDTEKAKKYTDCKAAKEESAYMDSHSIVLWPKIEVGNKIYAFSAVYGALIAHTDASNDDVPNLSPSNRLLRVSGAVLEDGTEVLLDREQANTLNGAGIVTAINEGGWRAHGNNTAGYPAVTDPKDRWITSRRFFTWWANSFILTYKDKIDSPANKALIETICDTENIRGNSLVSQGKCAGAKMEFLAEENQIGELLEGTLHFRQRLAPYLPAENIINTLSFDSDMLKQALAGGE